MINGCDTMLQVSDLLIQRVVYVSIDLYWKYWLFMGSKMSVVFTYKMYIDFEIMLWKYCVETYAWNCVDGIDFIINE